MAQHPGAMFGITATTPQMPATRLIAEVIRAQRPRARIILGGPHVTLVNAAYKREAKLDQRGRATRAYETLTQIFNVLVAGDGEESIFIAIGEDPPVLIDADIPRTPLFLEKAQLNGLPFPARHLVDVSSYHYEIDGVRALSLVSQLGCPFECGFCGGRESPSLRRVRLRETQNILEEIRLMHTTYGVNGFMFYDDELNVSSKMVELMDGIDKLQKQLGTEFRLRGFIKAELFTDAQADAMYRAGFRWILTGFESGSPRILKNINKKATRADNSRCVEIARRHGLKVKALMSMGHPGESDQTIRETEDWLLEARPDDFDVTIITTYPGTPYYDHALPHPELDSVWTFVSPITGDRLHSYEVDYNRTANYYKGDPDGGYQAFVFTDELDSKELVRRRDRLERDIRAQLGIAFNRKAVRNRYDHSMGQFGGGIPASILRSSAAVRTSAAP
jgi:radical SAM superfamily enzyme YgiQ (UPF0313 family)